MVKRFTGKDVNEATGIALQEIGVKLEDLDIKVISPGRSGILGFGGEHAEIEVSLISGESFEDELDIKSNKRKIFKSSQKVTRRKNKDLDKEEQVDPNNESIEIIEGEEEKLIGQLLDYFLGSMGVIAETFVRDDEEFDSLIFEIEGEDSGLLIGRRGETLTSLQFIIRMIARRQLDRPIDFYIDIQGYRDRRYRFIQNLAHRTAKKVIQLNEPIDLDPMPPNERKIIHKSLSRDSRIITESKGKGNTRRITIFPMR